jgi:hypothetical protein
MICGITPIMRTQAPTDFLLISSMMRKLKTCILKIPPMLPLGIICEFTLEKMLVVAVILTIS